MKREIIKPIDEQQWLSLRTGDLTSTDVAALFDCSPYLTSFELWHQKKSKMRSDFKENERADWGNYLESAIAAKFAKENNWTIRPMKEYIRIAELRLGSSFDFSIDCLFQNELHAECPEISHAAILEIKNVDSMIVKDKWIIDGDDVEAPPHIELQLQHQLLVSGRTRGFIGACIGGNRGLLIGRSANTKIQDAIISNAAKFWKSIEENREPEPNLERDSDFICSLYGYAEPGKVVDAASIPGLEEVMMQYGVFQQVASRATAQKEACKAKALMLIGDAEKVIAENWSISAGVVGPKIIETYTKAGYRNFRLNKKKVKEEANAEDAKA